MKVLPLSMRWIIAVATVVGVTVPEWDGVLAQFVFGVSILFLVHSLQIFQRRRNEFCRELRESNELQRRYLSLCERTNTCPRKTSVTKQDNWLVFVFCSVASNPASAALLILGALFASEIWISWCWVLSGISIVIAFALMGLESDMHDTQPFVRRQVQSLGEGVAALEQLVDPLEGLRVSPDPLDPYGDSKEALR